MWVNAPFRHRRSAGNRKQVGGRTGKAGMLMDIASGYADGREAAGGDGGDGGRARGQQQAATGMERTSMK